MIQHSFSYSFEHQRKKNKPPNMFQAVLLFRHFQYSGLTINAWPLAGPATVPTQGSVGGQHDDTQLPGLGLAHRSLVPMDCSMQPAGDGHTRLKILIYFIFI